MADLEVLDRGQLEPLGLDGAPKIDELLHGPEVGARRHAPAVRHRLCVWDPRAAGHVVDEVGDDRLGARLPSEPEVLRRQHLLVEPEPWFHSCLLVRSPVVFVAAIGIHGACPGGGAPPGEARADSLCFLQCRNGVAVRDLEAGDVGDSAGP